MGNDKKAWIKDVEELLELSVVEQAVARSLDKLNEAMDSLDADSHELISRYFNGTSLQDLSQEKALTVEEVSLWINKLKRDLQQRMREQFQVKQ